MLSQLPSFLPCQGHKAIFLRVKKVKWSWILKIIFCFQPDLPLRHLFCQPISVRKWKLLTNNIPIFSCVIHPTLAEPIGPPQQWGGLTGQMQAWHKWGDCQTYASLGTAAHTHIHLQTQYQQHLPELINAVVEPALPKPEAGSAWRRRKASAVLKAAQGTKW